MFSTKGRRVWRSSVERLNGDYKCKFGRRNEDEPKVSTEYGVVEGKCHVVNGSESACFLGIPYAKPPLGDLRFRKPEPPEPWTGIKKCKRFGARSIQNDMFWDRVVEMNPMSEDCLYLNVFAPKIEEGKSYPVMFYIHGGGFVMDSAVRYTPKNMTRLLTSQGIVLVTIQYRLGYLGYFCTGDSASKGNYGLWDQLMALEWTKRNIAQFGGDPKRITVAGQSAGAVSTDLLSLSPLSRDLFSQKILLGANSHCHWATTKTEDISAWCRRKAIKCGWKPQKEGYASTLEENEDMMAFMRTVPARKFATHMIGCTPTFQEARLPLAPVIDGEILPAPLKELRKTAPSMSSIVGVGEEESLLFVALGCIRCNEKDVQRAVRVISKKTGASVKEVTEAVKELYSDKKGRSKFATLLSDAVSNIACNRYMEFTKSHGKPCFAYSFDYTSQLMWGWLFPLIPYKAGTHASEIIYLFDCNYFSSPLPMTKTDRIVSSRFSRWIAQFVKSGDPNVYDESVAWEPISKDGPTSVLSVSKRPEMKQKEFISRAARFEEMLRSRS